MDREERTDRNWTRVLALLALLWMVAALPSWGQRSARVTPWWNECHGEDATSDVHGLRPLAEVLRSSRPDPALEGLLSGLPPPEHLASGVHPRSPSRERFGFAAQAEWLIRDLHPPVGSPRGLLRAARSLLQALDAPGRALCRLTGADNASFNPLKKRVSFTWYVDLP